MDLKDVSLFSHLSDKDRWKLWLFLQWCYVEKNKKLLNIEDEIKWIYLLLKWQVVVSDREWHWLWFINENSLIGVSIIYDYSKKIKKSYYNITTFKDCYFLIIPSDVIKHLTDKDRIIFWEIINQIRKEKKIYNF